MAKELLFIAAVHGDEAIGVNVCQKLSSEREDFEWLIGNSKAYADGKRFIDKDLNRSAPGNLNSELFEERRAAELIEISREYKYCIDLHGAKNKMGICIILTKLTKQNLRLASYFNIDTILYWPSLTPEMQYPVSEFFDCGLEIECGDKNNLVVADELQEILEAFLDNYKDYENRSDEECFDILKRRTIFEFKGVVTLKDPSDKDLFEELKRIDYNGEIFTPVFIQTYAEYKEYKGIFCYKLYDYPLSDLEKFFIEK